MFKSLQRFMPWATQALAVPPIPSLEDAVNNVHAPRRLESIVQHGSKMPVDAFVELGMPQEAFRIISGLINKKATVGFCAPVDFAFIDDIKPHAPPFHDRYVALLQNSELSIIHQRLSGYMSKPHPEDESYKYREPFFVEHSRLTGVLKGDFAYVALRTLVHPYGALSVVPAEPQHMLYFKELHDRAFANRRDALSTMPPPLPSPEERASMAERAAAPVINIKRGIQDAPKQ